MITRYSALVVASLLTISAWAALAKLVLQEVRKTQPGATVVLCTYDGRRNVERTYPDGNFCPMYIDC